MCCQTKNDFRYTQLELEIELLLRAVVSQDIMSIVQSNSVVDTPNIQTKLDPYNDMQQKIERLQAQLGDLKGKCECTPGVSDTLNPLSQKLKNENVELEFQVQVKKQSILGKPPSSSGSKIYSLTPFPEFKGLPKIDETHALSKPVTSNSVPTPQESKVVKNDNVIAPGMFRFNTFKTYREEKFVPNKPIKASVRTNLITVSQPHALRKKGVNSNSNGLSDNTTKTRRPQPKSNTKNDRVPSMSKSSCIKNKEVKVEEHPRNLLLSKNKKHMSSECNNVKLAIRNDKSEFVCAMCKQCLITANHDVCVLNYVNGMNSHDKKQKANVSKIANQKKHKPRVKKPKKVGSTERLASPKPSKPRSCLRWSPTGRLFDLEGKIIASSESESQSDCSNGDNAYSGCSKHMTRNLKLLINFVWKFLGTVHFGNDHIAAILGFGDLQWGNILITRVYFVEGLGYNLFSIGQFCDLNLEVAFRRNTCFVRNLEGVDLLKGNRTTNLYTINFHDMASAFPICLMARATSRSHGKGKRASHSPKPVPNSKQRLHLLYMDLCGPMRVKSINGKRYVLVIVDDYSRYTWNHFLRSKDEAPKVIKTFLKKTQVLLQALVIIVRTDNGTEFKNQVLKEYFDTIATACYTQNHSIIHRRFDKTPYELINGRKPDISFLNVFGALFYPKNDHEDIGKLGAKGDTGFFIGYSANSCAYRVYNQRTKKIMETMNVTFDELSAMAFEQSSLKPGLQSMTSGQISSGLDLTYAPSTITTQQLTERELDLLFEAMYDDYIGGQQSATPRTVPAAQAPQVLQTPTASTTIADTVPIPTNSSYQATNIPNTSQDVNELQTQQQHVQQQDNQAPLHPDWMEIHGDMCMYALTVSTIEPKNVKEAMTDLAWIESMQEELLQFKRLDVWVLVPVSYNIKPLTLKWLFKNKHDEENTIILNKTRLV
ncbi:retrovirus-related pol polyprotein from transposon TNT 1-94, partial [Tanacetum coccineum]